jgi:hypothetical protein
MSQINLDLVKFENRKETTFGIKMYDDYATGYDNNMTKQQFIDLDCDENDVNVLEYARDCEDDAIKEMIESVVRDETGITINGNYYDWDEIANRIVKD